MISAIIVDDSSTIRFTLNALIKKHCSSINIVGEADSTKNGISIIDDLKPQLIFLDIELGDGTGFNLLEELTYKDFVVIFITSHDTYALEAFKVQACSYLLKPIKVPDLISAVQKAEMLIPKPTLTIGKSNTNLGLIGISIENELLFIDKKKLVRCEAEGKRTKVVLEDRVVLASKNLKEFETILQEPEFIRVHHSHLVSTQKIISFSKSGNLLTMINNDQIPVSQRKREVLASVLTIL